MFLEMSRNKFGNFQNFPRNVYENLENPKIFLDISRKNFGKFQFS